MDFRIDPREVASQARSSLQAFADEGVTHYAISAADDACETCKAAAAAGPYLVTARGGPVPGELGCTQHQCRCAVSPALVDTDLAPSRRLRRLRFARAAVLLLLAGRTADAKLAIRCMWHRRTD